MATAEVQHTSDQNQIMIYAWQPTTIAESDVPTQAAVVTISPSQFRTILSSTTAPVQFALSILHYAGNALSGKKLVILIADEIQKYSVSVFEHKNEQRAKEIAAAQGRKIGEVFQNALKDLGSEQSRTIEIIYWKDIQANGMYDERVKHVRNYINNEDNQARHLIDEVCKAYVDARNRARQLKSKDLITLREYVINELPAILNGIEYQGSVCTLMLHPTLNVGNGNGDQQRQAMISLLGHMRKNYTSNDRFSSSMCHIFDVDIPISMVADSSLLRPSSSSSISSSQRSSRSGSTSSLNKVAGEPQYSYRTMKIDEHIIKYLLLTFILQISLLIFTGTWKQIFVSFMISAAMTIIYRIFIQYVSKTGRWYSESNEKETEVSGTNYQSFFGDLPSIQASIDGRFLYDLCKNLNQPEVYRIWMGPEPVLMLAHPRAVKEFWNQHNENQVQRNVNLGWPLDMIMGHGVGFRSIGDRNRITKYFHRAFGPNQVRHFDYELELIISEFFQRDSFESLESGAIKYLAHDSALYLFLGYAGMDYVDELHHLVDELAELMTIAFDARWTNLPLIGYYLLPNSYFLRRRIINFRKRVRAVLTKIIHVYRQCPLRDDEKNISIVASFARDPNPSITFDELADTIIEGLLAPNDGIAGTFMYMLILLSMYPEVEEKLRQEIYKSRDLTLESLKEISYLDQVLSETQRLLPIFMFNVPEFASQSMTVCNVHIPQNTMVMLDVVSLNHNVETWQPDPGRFRPERFAPPLSPALLKSYHGFGNGHLRRCLGQHFVKSFNRLFLAHLLTQKRIVSSANIKTADDIPRHRLPFIYVPTGSVRLMNI